jgi:hypothetical protein
VEQTPIPGDLANVVDLYQKSRNGHWGWALTDREKERIKLRAAAFDRASTAAKAIGVFAPAAGYLLGTAPFSQESFWLMGVFVALAVILHYIAIGVLGGLDS